MLLKSNNKNAKSFQCSECGVQTSKWAGQCQHCGTWGSFGNEIKEYCLNKNNLKIQILKDIEEEDIRFMQSMPEFDLVCGQGIPSKGVILIAGEPGIGKSTLLLQICDAVSTDKVAVYITAEEAVDQVKLRAKRLGVSLAKIACAASGCVENIITALLSLDPSVVVIDSIQTIYSENIDSTPGSVNQLRACTHALIEWCKTSNSALILVGHVTKEGVIAGPKVVEHMVDTVLYFEGERGDQPLRVLRSIKNRFGSTDVIGVFEITEQGLKPMKDISKAFITHKTDDVIGSCTIASLDGNRIIMLEIQALISDAPMQSPRRMAVGWDNSRMHTIIAILESKCRIPLGSKHVYCSIVGGIKIVESAGDLPAAIAIISEAYKANLSPFIAAFGEISPSGEIREVKKMHNRAHEAFKLGFQLVLVPGSYDATDTDPRILRFSKISDVSKWIKNQQKQGR